MARIRINLPERFGFSTELPLYLAHINYAGHLDNAMLLTVVSEARQRFFAALGYAELDVEGRGIVVADASVQYRSEAFHGESMRVEMSAVDFDDYGCDLVWRMTAAGDGREVARGRTGIVFFDYAARRKAAVPEAFRERVGEVDAVLG